MYFKKVPKAKTVVAPAQAIPPTTGMFKAQAVAIANALPPNQAKSNGSAILYGENTDIKARKDRKNIRKIKTEYSVEIPPFILTTYHSHY